MALQVAIDEPVHIKFVGMSNGPGSTPMTPLSVNYTELIHLLAVGMVEVRANKIRSEVIRELARAYGPVTKIPEPGLDE